MNILKLLDRFSNRVIDILGILGAFLMLFIMMIVCAGVFMRSVFNKPIPGIEEIAQDCLLYAAFLMAIWLMRFDGHARVDLVINYLKPKKKAIMNMILYFVCAFICLVLTWFGVKVLLQDFAFDLHETSYLMLPTWILIIIIPVGYLLMFTQVIKAIGKYYREFKSVPKVLSASELAELAKKSVEQKVSDSF